jgi:cobalt-zinc-cadmium efflux system outer membrane protein
MRRKTRQTCAWPVLAIVAASLCITPSIAFSAAPNSVGEMTIQAPTSAAEAVRLAFQNRPGIAAAQSEVESLLVKAKAVRTSDPLRLLVGRGSDSAPGATDNDLALSQAIDWFGRNSLAASVVEFEAVIARANLRRVRLEVQTDVLYRFNAVVFADGKLRLARELLDIAVRFRDAAKRRVEAGQAPEVQLLRANIELERASQVLELREVEAKTARSRLRGAIGATEEPAPTSFFLHQPPAEPDLMQQHPRVLALSAELQEIDARIRHERVANRPDVEFQVRRSPWMERGQLGVRLQVSVPLTDYGRSRRNVESLRLSRRGIEQQRDDVIRVAITEFQSLKVERAAAERQVERLNSLIGDAKELLRINEKGFETGALTLLESLEAARSLRDIEEASLDSRFRLANLDVALILTEGYLLVEGA